MARWTVRRLAASLALAGIALTPDGAWAQAGASKAAAQLRIKVQGNAAASGVISFPRQGPNAVVSVVALDAAGKPVTAALSGAKWETSDEDVVSLYGGSSGASTRIVAQQNGRATLTVTALGKSASMTVVVGAARKEVAASEVVPAYRVARLEAKQYDAHDPDATLSGRALLLAENGHNASIRILAYAADGKPIPLDDLPVTWATSDADVIELMQENESEVRVVGREPGQAKVTATIQGVTLTLDGYVGDARQTADAGTLAATPSVTAGPAVAVAPGATALPTAPTIGSTGAIATSPSGTTTTSTTAPPSTTITATAPAGAIATTAPAKTVEATTGAVTATAPTGIQPTTMDAASKAGLTKLDPPTKVQAVYMGGGRIAAAWTKMPEATGYTILIGLPSGSYSGANPLDQQWYTDTIGGTRELAPGTYAVSVMAQYGSENDRSPPSQAAQVTIPKWYGKYRVSVLGFKAIRETTDDPLQIDGKHDEVYVRVKAQERDLAGNPVGSGRMVESYVHGDVNHDQWRYSTSPTYRIKAGTASALGGIVTGNAFPTGTPWIRFNPSDYEKSFPMLVWEGDLKQGDNAVVVVPTIWESDRRPSMPATVDLAAFAAEEIAEAQAGAQTARRLLASDFTPPDTLVVVNWLRVMTDATPTTIPMWVGRLALRGQLPALPVTYFAVENVPVRMDSLGARYRAAAAKFGTAASKVQALATKADAAATTFGSQFVQNLSLALNAKDRPLGIVPVGLTYGFQPLTLTLTYESVERALAGAGPHGLGPGVWQVDYQDKVFSQGGAGSYSLWVQVQRVP